ncbi:hypothetical protein ACEQPO_20995 [Bacillus sp. SL00103]
MKSHLLIHFTACDSARIYLGSVTGGNVHDSRMLDSLVSKVTEKVGKNQM